MADKNVHEKLLVSEPHSGCPVPLTLLFHGNDFQFVKNRSQVSVAILDFKRSHWLLKEAIMSVLLFANLSISRT